MNEPKSLSEITAQKKSLDYDFLIKEGVSLIQRFSGNKWTDYNYHDPGITFLEQLCYALTDLGYRVDFNIEDILLINKDNFDIENENLLIPLNKILSTSPLTIKDFRKFIIQRIDNVKNVWIEIIKDNSMGLDGLLIVSLQCNENLSDEEILNTKNNVYDLLMDSRSISTDIEKIKVLKKEKIEISATIKLDPFALGESVLAEIYYRLDKLLNPEIFLNDYEKMIDLGYDKNEIFSGPESRYGYIESKDLTHKTNSIYIIEIKELIESIEGVDRIEDIKIFKNGVILFNDLITFNENSYPSLKKTILDYNNVNEKIIFLRNDSIYGIDSIILSQLYDSLMLDSKSIYKKNLSLPFPNEISGRFNENDINKYYSIQNEFPSVYGLKKDELPKDSSKKRVAQVKQLKAYLYFFEQIMANYLSQLSNTRNFFSINNKKAYFNQLPENIPDFKKIINHDVENFKIKLDIIINNKESNNKKKNQIIDHLLSRFNEQYDLTILSKLSMLYDDEVNTDSLLAAKISYSNHIVELGQTANKGFNYNKNIIDTFNCSGLEKRIKLLLNIKNLKVKSLSSTLSNNLNNTKIIWKDYELYSEDGLRLNIYSINEKDYNSNQVFYFSRNNKNFKSLFVFGKKKKSYKIIKSYKNNTYSVLYNSPFLDKPTRIFLSKDKSNCHNIIKNSLNKFKKLNIECEGFYIIEHILLRPSTIIKYKNFIYENDNKLLFKSIEFSDFEAQKDLRSDLYLILDSENYYKVHKINNSSKYSVKVIDIFEKPVLTSHANFLTKKDAIDFISFSINFFQNQKLNGISIVELSQIKMDNNRFNEFPSNFTFSNKISIVCPNWPARFQNMEFISLFKKYIKRYIPVHIDFDFFLIDIKNMSVFENSYFNWMKMKSQKSKKIDKYSIEMIQLLNNYKS